MSVTIDGSLGITTPSETSTGPIVAPTIGASSGSNLSLQSNGVTNATLDTNGNLGLGVTPSAWSTVGPVIQFADDGFVGSQGNTGTFYVGQNHYYNGSNFIYTANGYATQYQCGTGSGSHTWYTAPSGTAGTAVTFTQAMTLDSVGLLVNETSRVSNSTHGFAFPGASKNGIEVVNYNASGVPYMLGFYFGSTQVGSIASTSTTTAYNTTSDQRLKTDLGIASQSRILDVKIHDYEWKLDGSKARGVFAQEAHQVIPEAVSVGSDEIDENGNLTKPWAVDYSKFVPDLIVMVQEQQEMINQLKAEIAELKGAK